MAPSDGVTIVAHGRLAPFLLSLLGRAFFVTLMMSLFQFISVALLGA